MGQTLPPGEVKVKGLGGNDSVRFVCNESITEVATIHVDRGNIKFAGTQIQLIGFNDIKVIGNDGDRAILHDDDNAADFLEVRSLQSILESGNFTRTVLGFEKVTIKSDWNGNDVALVGSSSFKRLIAEPDVVKLKRDIVGMNHVIEGFEHIETVSIRNFSLLGSNDADTLSVRKNKLEWEVPNYQLVQDAPIDSLTADGGNTTSSLGNVDKVEFKLFPTSESFLNFDYISWRDNELTYSDALTSIELNDFQKVDIRTNPGPHHAEARINYLNQSGNRYQQPLEYTVNAEAKRVKTAFSKSDSLADVFTGFTDVKVDSNRFFLRNIVSIDDSSMDDEVFSDGLFTRFSNEEFNFEFTARLHRVEAYAKRGGFDVVNTLGNGGQEVVLRPDRSQFGRDIIDFDDNPLQQAKHFYGFDEANHVSSGGRLRVLGVGMVEDANREIMASPGSLSDIGTNYNFHASGFDTYLVTGTDDGEFPTAKVDYGDVAGRLPITYDNQNDSSVELIKNGCIVTDELLTSGSYYAQLGWEYRTSTSRFFVSRIDGFDNSADQMEIKGIRKLNILNVPSNMPETFYPLDGECYIH